VSEPWHPVAHILGHHRGGRVGLDVSLAHQSQPRSTAVAEPCDIAGCATLILDTSCGHPMSGRKDHLPGLSQRPSVLRHAGRPRPDFIDRLVLCCIRSFIGPRTLDRSSLRALLQTMRIQGATAGPGGAGVYCLVGSAVRFLAPGIRELRPTPDRDGGWPTEGGVPGGEGTHRPRPSWCRAGRP
jgi:hypothetical protein